MGRPRSEAAGRGRVFVWAVVTGLLATVLAGCGPAAAPGSHGSAASSSCVASLASVTTVSGAGTVTVRAGAVMALSLITPFGLVAEPTTQALLPWATPLIEHDTAQLRRIPPCGGLTLPRLASGEESRWFFRARRSGSARVIVPISVGWRDAYSTTLCAQTPVSCEHPKPVTLTVIVS